MVRGQQGLSRLLIVFEFLISKLTGIEGIPWVFMVNTQANPLCNNLLLTNQDRTSRMFRKPLVGVFRLRIYVRKKDGIALFWVHVDAGISKVGVPSDFGKIAARKEISEMQLPSSTKAVWGKGH